MKKLKGGCYEVRLLLAPDMVTFAETQWQALGHPSIDDYLNTVLNTALVHEEVRVEDAAEAQRQPVPASEDLEPVFAPEPPRRRKHSGMPGCGPQEPLF